MRTDTERLDWILAALDSGNGEPLERLQAAYTLELRGRTAMDAAMGAKIVEPGEPMPALTAIDLAIAEVGRIRNVKGFSEERDDGYVNNELAEAAACYMFLSTERSDAGGGGPAWWPWDSDTFKPSPDDRKRELTKGIALALCELDRVIRAERRAPVTIGIDLASGPDQCVVDGVLHPQPREFKVGDRVRIARKVTVQAGWNNMWVSPEMDRMIGSSGVIKSISDFGVRLLDVQYAWPSDSLEHADD
jgi:hypothetical protein